MSQRACILAVAHLFSTAGFAGTPALVAPGGVWWQPRNILTIDKLIELSSETRIEGDEIRINAPVVTNGHGLTMQGRRVVFGPEGKIMSFIRPADEGIAGPAYGAAGKSGGRNENGENGGDGKVGNDGRDGIGADGKSLPGEIRLFAAEFEGAPTVIASGQQGGKGGTGGKGQAGGEGGQGSAADASDPCFFGGNTSAGPGFTGGNFGKGGKGGKGGAGGSATPTRLFTTLTPTAFSLGAALYGEPGSGGDGGDAGSPGAGGAGGPGGEGDSDTCWIPFLGGIKKVLPQGATGPAGQACVCAGENKNCLCQEGDAACITNQCTLGKGEKGFASSQSSADILKDILKRDRAHLARAFDAFEHQRFDVTLEWFEFHWWRLTELLLHRSIQLLDDLKSNDELADLDAILAQDVKQEILVQVRRQWKTHFVDHSERLLASKQTDARAKLRLEKAIKLAKKFDFQLGRIHTDKGIDSVIAKTLSEILEEGKTARLAALKVATDSCGKYVGKVLQSDLYRTQLADTQFHFTIPACEQAALFTEDNAATMRPIELVANIQAVVPAGLKDQIIVTEMGADAAAMETGFFDFDSMGEAILNIWSWLVPSAYAANEPPELSIIILGARKIKAETLRIGAFDKAVPVRFSELGVQRGYLNPETKGTTLQSLATGLNAIAAFGVKP
jgi:hypothetical protein